MGLPDRGRRATGTWGYEQMDNRGVILSEMSLYAQRPIRTLDLLNFGWIDEATEVLTINTSNFNTLGEIKITDVNEPLTQTQINNNYYRLVKVLINDDSSTYFLVEFHNASSYDKNFSNDEEYGSNGYNTGALIWHVEHGVDLELAVPYNGWDNRTPIPNDGYPRGNYSRPTNYLDGQYYLGNDEFDYLNDIDDPIVYYPDGGKNIWSNTLDNNGDPNNPMDWLPRLDSKRSDFFTDEVIQGRVRDRMTDATRPSTKSNGWLELRVWDPEINNYRDVPHEAEKTHIGIVDFTKQNDGINDYMTVKVYYNYWEGTIDENSTMSGNVIIGDDLTIASGVTLTIQEGTEVVFEENAKLVVNGDLIVNGSSSNQVLFTSSDPNPTLNDWYGIEVNGSNASATLNYCTVEYAGSGIKFSNGSTGTVSNSEFSNNYYGVYIHSSNPIINNSDINYNKYGIRIYNSYTTPNWSTTHISDCNITNSNYYGLYIYNSSPTLSGNIVSNNNRGAVLYYDSDPIIEESNFNSSSSYGLACSGSASPNLNYNSTYSFGGYNNVLYNNYSSGAL